MNYQSNLTKFENKLEKEVSKLFKLHENGAEQTKIEEQELIVEKLKNIVDSLEVLANI